MFFFINTCLRIIYVTFRHCFAQCLTMFSNSMNLCHFFRHFVCLFLSSFLSNFCFTPSIVLDDIDLLYKAISNLTFERRLTCIKYIFHFNLVSQLISLIPFISPKFHFGFFMKKFEFSLSKKTSEFPYQKYIYLYIFVSWCV